MNSLRIIFMGTPEFSVPSLDILVQAGYDVVAVVTAPDRPKGRGKLLGESAVKKYAVAAGIPVLQPEKLKDTIFINQLISLKANLFVVVAFRMLPEVVWKIPALGTFNLHASLLPKYRGAAPINWAIINGETETGVTTFFLQHEIDTGDIILQEKEPIHAEDDAGSLYNRLMEKGAKLVMTTVMLVETDSISLKPQNTVNHSSAPKIFREDCKINWNQTTKKIVDFVRGLSPYPGAWTERNGKTFKLFKVQATSEPLPAGIWKEINHELHIGCSDGAVRVLTFQPEGKNRMNSSEYLKGNTI